MNRVLLLLLICVVIVLGILACGGISDTVNEDGPLFVLVTDEKDLVEEDYNDLALQGFQRAKDEFGVRIEMVQTSSADEYIDGIKIGIEKGAVLIVCNGASMTEAVKEAAAEYPDQAFALIDGEVDATNVSCYTFSEEQGAFLAGVVATSMSETNIIGFVWDVQNPKSEKYQYSFEAGVQSASADAQVLINYIESPGDQLLCKETALAQNKLGVDVILHGPGACGEGVIKAAEEQNFWVIGIDKNQSVVSPTNSLCVALKRFDIASYMAIEDYNNGTARGVHSVFSLENEGVELADTAGNLTEEALATLKVWREKIIAEKIVVPFDGASFYQFFAEK